MTSTAGEPAAAVLAGPTRLPPSKPAAPLAPTPTHGAATTPLAITVRLLHLPKAWRTAASGVAFGTDAARDGLVWALLPEAAADGTFTLHHTVRTKGPLTITVATSRGCASHGYLVRRTFDVTAASTIELDASAAPITLRRRSARQGGGPFRIVRRDDPDWLPPVEAGAVLVAVDAPGTLWLGHGDYELRDPLHEERRQAFTVPLAEPLELSAALAPIPADRP